MLSYNHDVNSHLSLMTSLFYTQWSSYKQLWIHNTVLHGDASQTVDFRNTVNLSAGANVTLNNGAVIKFGLGFDETPTNQNHRDVRSPDTNHFTVSTGYHIDSTNGWSADIGLAHIFLPESVLNGGYVIHYPGTPSKVSLHGASVKIVNTIGYRHPSYFKSKYLRLCINSDGTPYTTDMIF